MDEMGRTARDRASRQKLMKGPKFNKETRTDDDLWEVLYHLIFLGTKQKMTILDTRYLRRMHQVKYCNMELVSLCTKGRLRSLGHVLRMPDNNLAGVAPKGDPPKKPQKGQARNGKAEIC